MIRWLIILCAMLTGCTTGQPDPAGIPNLFEVEPGVWRGGQPTNNAAWLYLKSIGITNVVKLNPKDTGSDAYAESMGMRVSYFPITIEQQVNPWGDDLQRMVPPAAKAITPGTFVHCEHGEDRTGVVIGYYRLLHGWSKEKAEAEMLAHGFHKVLAGLWEYWEDCKPGTITPL